MKRKLWKQAKQFIDKLDVDEVVDFDINTRDYGDELGISIDVTVGKDEIEENEEPTATVEFDYKKLQKHIKEILANTQK